MKNGKIVSTIMLDSRLFMIAWIYFFNFIKSCRRLELLLQIDIYISCNRIARLLRAALRSFNEEREGPKRESVSWELGFIVDRS